jgi:hypothetical protein
LSLCSEEFFFNLGAPAIHASPSQSAVGASVWEAPAPVLFNAWKHHAEFLRLRVRDAAAAGPASLDGLAKQLVVMGTELMDLYVGRLTPAEIGAAILDALRAEGRLEAPAFRAWVQEAGGYRVLPFAADGSRWVLRMGDEHSLYVHAHPGRWAPQTRRVRANVLKTAVMALADAALHGGDALDQGRVNAVRRQYFGLSPVGKELAGDQGLGAIIDLLKS